MHYFLKKIFFSTKTTLLLLIVSIFSMAFATFLESFYSTDVAKIFIYESKWFEFILFMIIINIIGNIWKYKLWNLKKIPIFMFHISFIIIFIGGVFTRYFNNEGFISIREGESTDKVISQKSYMKIKIFDNSSNKYKYYYDPYIFSSFLKNKYEKSFSINKNNDFLSVKIVNYIPCVKEYISTKNPKDKFIKIVSTENNKRIEFFIKEGSKKIINGIYFSFNKKISNGIEIFEKNKKIFFKSFFHGKNINMINGKIKFFKKNSFNNLLIKSLYKIDISPGKTIYWVVPSNIIKGQLKYKSFCDKNDNDEDKKLSIITAKISTKNKIYKTLTFFGGKKFTEMSNPIKIGNYKISIGYGSILWKLPFYLNLKKFKLENYPGSNFPSSFTSFISLIDKNSKNNKSNDYSIHMNNVLKYKGYRFFQSGYDPDKKGTFLSVNNDYLGTYFSYIGYTLMCIGMTMSIFWKGTRFYTLRKSLNKIMKKKGYTTMIIIFLFSFFIGTGFSEKKIYANEKENAKKIKDKNSLTLRLEDVSEIIHISKEHAEKFGKLLIQDQKGRIKPINTIAIELLRKIHKKNSVGGLNANQWFISMHSDNILWMKIPFIKVDKKGKSDIFQKIRISEKDYVSITDLYVLDSDTMRLKYILQEDYDTAFSKSPNERNDYEKLVIKITERINIIHDILQGKYTRIFPIPNDSNNTWVSWVKNNEIYPSGLSMFNRYMNSLYFSQNKKNWIFADNEIENIKKFQKKYAKSILPSENKINIEIIYNKINIFYYLSFFYAIFGLLLATNSFFEVFIKKKKIITIFQKILFSILLILFFIEFIGLSSRWYISNHAPWTNGYESAIFISWCLLLVGFLFYKNSFVLSITSLISSILLFIAHGSEMDPEITNLVPVLKSSWLIIHVATITSSYGFFFTSSLLGFLILILYILKRYFSSYHKKIKNRIKKLTIINEICITIGIFLLSIGTILGAVWANNSWGSYWSWDPKETWALISIMTYSIVLHIRLIPSIILKNFIFNFLSVLSISTIIMTYFGVNYYLSGLHSYAKGDHISFPFWIYPIIIIFFIVSIISYNCEKKLIKVNSK